MRARTFGLRWTLALAGLVWAAQVRADATGELSLAWGNCRGAGGAPDRSFACDGNLGQNVLVGSFTAPASITALRSVDATVQIVPQTDQMPFWWLLASSGQCRSGALSGYADFRDLAGCSDPFGGNASGGVTSYLIYPYEPMSATLRLTWTVPAGSELALDPGVEYYAFKVVIDNTKTVGGYVCGGCSTPMCLLFSSLKLNQPAGTPGGSPFVFPLDGYDQHIANWNGGTSAICGVVPARNTTWGQIKSLYR